LHKRFALDEVSGLLKGAVQMREVENREQELIRRRRAGDDEAFETMVRQYGGRMLIVARRFLRVEQDARDAVQEALLSAFKSIHGFAGEAKLSTWLHRIVVNAALMQLRSRKRRNEDSIEELMPRFDDRGGWADRDNTQGNVAEEIMERRCTRELLRKCIARLPEIYRNVLMMRDIEELENQEVAEMLGAHPNTVKVRLHRAHQALRAVVLEELRASGELSQGVALS
jgi:RNA polymerase sigma-70 factor, ECF subfamily